MKKKCLIIVALVLSGVLGFSISWRHYNKELDIQTLQTFHYPTVFVNQLRGDPLTGKKIFFEYCSACHGENPKIDILAPRINDQKAWDIKRQLGTPTLLKITITGIGAMPARGGCFECSDEQLLETIRYILKQSQ